MTKSEIVRFGVSVPRTLLERFDSLLAEKGYRSRSEGIRDLIRDRLVKEEWQGNQEVVGSLTFVYDHGVRRVTDRIVETQHTFHGNVVSSMHVHLSEHKCMEVLILEGTADEVKRISDHILSSRGVQHGELVMTTRGEALE
jgi:CopG family nickel-responsive transcriptional regulator